MAFQPFGKVLVKLLVAADVPLVTRRTLVHLRCAKVIDSCRHLTSQSLTSSDLHDLVEVDCSEPELVQELNTDLAVPYHLVVRVILVACEDAC